jgi:GNAT superfamily N-acetyltransferase
VTAGPPAPYRFVDLSPGPNDAALLSRFYQALYVDEFPDPDERESLANMLHYLEHRGSHGNDYIVTLLCEGDVLAGGSICDYFVRSNCGAIEFLMVKPSGRGRGLGTALARHVQRRMAEAAEARGPSLAFVMAEMNDPFEPGNVADNLDPFERLRFWHRLGYRRAAFPYVQPALSPEQSPVRNLLLAALPVQHPETTSIEPARAIAFLRDYLVYAMRFDDPEQSAEFREMRAHLAARAAIPLEALDDYVAGGPAARRALG